MPNRKTGEFEAAIDRLEQIVKELEAGDIGLDESVRLYREGRDLARKCEQLLKAAQDEVDAASRDGAMERGATRGARSTEGPDADGLPL